MNYKWPQKKDALEPGIYFGLNERVYHEDSALSRSGIATMLLETPFEFWVSSWMNEERKAHSETDAMKWGTEFHMLLLEPKRFRETYFVFPGEPYDGENRKLIKEEDYKTMKVAVDVIKSLPLAKDLFTEGYPEVTLVWPDTQTGLMLRARLDYMKPYSITDVKTCYSLREQKLKYQFKEHYYHVQNAMYSEGMRVIREMLKQDKCGIFGNEVDNNFLMRFMEDAHSHFAFVMQKKKFPYPARIIHPLEQHEVIEGREIMHEGITRYIEHIERYGTKPWPVSEGKAESFSMYHGFNKHY